MTMQLKAIDLLKQKADEHKPSKQNITTYLSSSQIEKLDDLVDTSRLKNRSAVIGALVEFAFVGLI